MPNGLDYGRAAARWFKLDHQLANVLIAKSNAKTVTERKRLDAKAKKLEAQMERARERADKLYSKLVQAS